jgi:ATP-dependent Clp protease ATP-binding subunit ClpC
VSKPSFRVYFVVHENGHRTGTLMRTWDQFFDRPPPAAYGGTTEDVYAQLEQQLHRIQAEKTDDITRYLWTVPFSTQEVRVDIHPLSSVKKRPVIGKQKIPLVLTYAHCPLEGGGHRVMIPRFGGWFIVEELSLAADVLRHAVSNFLLGDNPRTVYDFRHVGAEFVAEWSPPFLMRAREAPPSGHEEEFPELSKIADDLVERASKGKLPPPVGDCPELEAIKPRLAESPPPSLLLVGPPGVGKTTFVRRLAAEALAARRGKQAGPTRVWSTSKDRVIAGMVYLGMWQERCLTLVKELSFEGDYLHVDRLAAIVEPQPDGASIADFLEPAMAGGEISVIAECTPSELERMQRTRPSLIRRFTPVRIAEPGQTALLELLHAYAKRKPGLAPHPAGLRRLVRHLSATQRSSAFPGKGIRFIDWLAQSATTKTLYPREISEAYSRYSGIPLQLLSDDVSASAEDLANMLRARVIGQDAACDACGRLLARFKADMVDPERPCGVLLFVGPTGVGKTELAKQLARTLFGGEERMIRLDMSEYMLPGSARRLLDVRPGVLSLAARVAEQPLSLVLLDEIEKAHPEVFDLLLGVLGEGRLTDDSGRLVDFRGTIIVMTSNLGVSDTRPVGFGEGGGDDHARAARMHFRPELFNRIDYVLPFRALARADVERIVDLEIAAGQKRTGLVRREIRLALTSGARARLAELGHHPTRGARPLKRVLEERVFTPLAAKLSEDVSFHGREVLVATAGEAPTGAWTILV